MQVAPHVDAGPELGMRRVAWLRVTVDGDSVRYEAVGHGDRLPTVRPVGATTAAALARAGVPAVVRHIGQEPGVYVCHCRAVTDRTVVAAIAAGASDPPSLARACGAGARCGGCWPTLERLLAECVPSATAGAA